MVDKSLQSVGCMEGHWGTLKVVMRTKLAAQIRACLTLKEHLMKMSGLELRSCASLRLALMSCSNGCCGYGSTVENSVFPLHLNLYLDYVCSWKVLIASVEFGAHQAELEGVWVLQQIVVGNMSSVVASSFDMEHLSKKTNKVLKN